MFLWQPAKINALLITFFQCQTKLNFDYLTKYSGVLNVVNINTGETALRYRYQIDILLYLQPN